MISCAWGSRFYPGARAPDYEVAEGRASFFMRIAKQRASMASLRPLSVATSVTVETTDTRTLRALVDQIKDNTGRLPRRLLADAGYCRDENLDAYVAVGRVNITEHGPFTPSPRGRIPAGLTRPKRISRKPALYDRSAPWECARLRSTEARTRSVTA